MAFKDKVKAVVAARVDAATLTGGGTYDVFNPGGLVAACFYLRFVNDSNLTVEISYDGARTHDIVLADSQHDINFQSNARPSNNVANMPKGTVVYILGDPDAQTAGYIYLIGYYYENQD